MNLVDMIKVLENERECVSRDCKYECAECDLVLPQEQILETYNNLLEMLSKEEAESKRHGHWIEEPLEDEWGKLPSIWHCSECDNLELNNSPYCPCCGARMDGAIDEWEEPEINPCRGCIDYDGRGGCKSNGGCGTEMNEVEDAYS